MSAQAARFWRFCNLLDNTLNYPSHTGPIQHCSSQSGIGPNHDRCCAGFQGGKQCRNRFIEPIPEEILTSVWFLHVRFSSIKTPRDLVEYN